MQLITTWNVNSINVRKDHVREFLMSEKPLVLALQELKCDNNNFPKELLDGLDYHYAINGQKTYNGVALISSSPICDIDYGFVDDSQKRIISATIGNARYINIYVPNGESIESDKYPYKLEWLKRFNVYLQDSLNRYETVIVMGDFNIAPSDYDVYSPPKWRDKVLCSEPERKAFDQLLGLGFVDALTVFARKEPMFTWWDYRQNGYENDLGLRIDHLLLSTKASAKLITTKVFKKYREKERSSDHAPTAIYLKD